LMAPELVAWWCEGPWVKVRGLSTEVDVVACHLTGVAR
jgi:hypothetical protein